MNNRRRVAEALAVGLGEAATGVSALSYQARQLTLSGRVDAETARQLIETAHELERLAGVIGVRGRAWQAIAAQAEGVAA